MKSFSGESVIASEYAALSAASDPRATPDAENPGASRSPPTFGPPRKRSHNFGEGASEGWALGRGKWTS